MLNLTAKQLCDSKEKVVFLQPMIVSLLILVEKLLGLSFLLPYP